MGPILNSQSIANIRFADPKDLIIANNWTQWDAYRQKNKNQQVAGYASWLQVMKRNGSLPIEYLTPIIKVCHSDALPLAMQKAAERFDVQKANEISQLDWGYYFHIGGGLSTIGPEDELTELSETTNRYRSVHRLRMIGKIFSALYGNGLTGKTCIDLACNWGAFSLELAARGCGRVFGVDYRHENIHKANVLKNYVGFDNVEYVRGDVYHTEGQYDIVLNLGLLYHVTQPFELVRKTFDLCREVAVIETVTHREPFSGFILSNGGSIRHEHAAGVVRTELHPTYRALLDMMHMVGFKDLVEIEGEPDPRWTDFDKGPFGTKTRRAIMGFK